MKLTVNTSELFNLNMSWDATGIAENVYNRAISDAENIDEAFESLYDALNDELIYINDELIYIADQWTIMQEYQTPDEANFNEAYEMFYEDLCRHFYEIVEETE